MTSRRSRDFAEYESQDAIEIPSLSGSIVTAEDNAAVDQQLEPADGGRAAWIILCAAFMFEALLWGEHYESNPSRATYPFIEDILLTRSTFPGFPISFGVFQDYYSELPEFKGNPYIPLVGTMASGIPYLGAPFMAILVRRYQLYRRQIIWMGWPLCIIGLVASSFANSLGALIVSQGIMYGGTCNLTLLPAWWI